MKRSTKKPRPKYITAGQGELLRARLGALEGWRLIVEANLSSIERYLPDSNIAKRVCDLEDQLQAINQSRFAALAKRVESLERSRPDGSMLNRVAAIERDVAIVAQRQMNPPNDLPLNLEKRLDLLDGAVARQAAELAELARRLALLEAPKPKRWWWQL